MIADVIKERDQYCLIIDPWSVSTERVSHASIYELFFLAKTKETLVRSLVHTESIFRRYVKQLVSSSGSLKVTDANPVSATSFYLCHIHQPLCHPLSRMIISEPHSRGKMTRYLSTI